MQDRILLLGSKHTTFNEVAQENLGFASACLSPGADPNSPSFQNKGDKSKPNEDSLLVLRQGTSWLLAVADGHFGTSTAEAMVEHLSRIPRIPQRLGPLSLWLSSLQLPNSASMAGATLTVACFEETTRKVVGLSLGDSSIATISEVGFELLNQPNENYIRPTSGVAIELACKFDFNLAPDAMLLLYSDGVNECCYRCPEYSIQGRHFQELYAKNPSPADFSLGLARLALAGVDGQVGGQDNIAVVALSTT